MITLDNVLKVPCEVLFVSHGARLNWEYWSCVARIVTQYEWYDCPLFGRKVRVVPLRIKALNGSGHVVLA